MKASVGMKGSLNTTFHQGDGPPQKKTKVRRTRNFAIPGLGRIAFRRDPGEASLFAEKFLRTNLKAKLINPYGEIIEDLDLGSGMVTNVGVLALANDFTWPSGGVTKAAKVNTLNASKWHAWGTTNTAAAKTDFELAAYAAPTTANAVEGTNSLVFETAGKNQTLKSKGTIKAESTISVVEWGLHSEKALKPANKEGAAGAPTATSFKTEAASLTASTEEVRGATNNVAWVEKSVAVIGLITKNTTGEVTVPGWIKAGAKLLATTPKEKANYQIIQMLFARRLSPAIGVEIGNEVTFEWSLEIVPGG